MSERLATSPREEPEAAQLIRAEDMKSLCSHSFSLFSLFFCHVTFTTLTLVSQLLSY